MAGPRAGISATPTCSTLSSTCWNDDSGVARFLLDFGRSPALTRELIEPRLERSIGVIYRPDTELESHYAEAALSRRFDAFLWFDETRAVAEIGPERHAGVPDTFPFGI
jgi:hypothetical protein